MNTGEERQNFWTEIETLGKIREAGDSPDTEEVRLQVLRIVNESHDRMQINISGLI